MSTLKVNKLNNSGTAIDFPYSLRIKGNVIEQGYYESSGEPYGADSGDLWWNTSDEELSQYVGNEWRTWDLTAPAYMTWGGDRGFAIGGYGDANTIDYYDITTAGNASTFGEASDAGLSFTTENVAVSSGERVVYHYDNSNGSHYYYIAAATLGNGAGFGDNANRRGYSAGASDGTYGIQGGGNGGSNIIDYITIATLGDAQDFGDLTVGRGQFSGLGGSTRGVFIGGGSVGSLSDGSNTMDYITIATPGNATDFGDTITGGWNYMAACSDATRGVIAGGTNGSGTNVNTIEYITVDTASDATDFGDLHTACKYLVAGANATYACFSGGHIDTTNNQIVNIQRITIQTTGNATDHGDLVTGRRMGAGSSGNAA